MTGLERRLRVLEGHRAPVSPLDVARLDAEIEALAEELAEAEGTTPEAVTERGAAEMAAEDAERWRWR